MYCRRKEAPPQSAAQHTAAGAAVEDDDTRHRSHRCCTPPAAGGRRAPLLHSWDTAAGAAGSADGPTDPSKVAHAHTDHTADEDDGGVGKGQAAVRSRPGVRAAAAPRLDTQGTELAEAATKFV